jgi:hypothetical protein
MKRNTPIAQPERRKQTRVRFSISGRYTLTDGHEYPCAIIDGSSIGLSLRGSKLGTVGEKVIAYVDQVGRLEGEVVRRFRGGFAMRFDQPSLASRKLGSLVERHLSLN